MGFQPYHPYFHRQYYHSPYFHYNPYFYYNYHHKKPAKEEKEEPVYPESDFYPFYMAKPTEEEIEEHQEKMKEYEEKMKKEFEEYEAKAKEHQEKMKAAADELELPEHPLNTLEEDAAAEGEEGKGKTISLPVFYNSYFPRWRYTHFKKPVMEEEPEAKKPEEDIEDEAIKEL